VGNKSLHKQWSIDNGDYIRKNDDQYLNMDDLRKKEKIKKFVFLEILLIIAFSAEFFILKQIAKI